MPKLVIFDLDQTLIDVFAAHDKAFHATMAEVFGITACYKTMDHTGRRIPDLIRTRAMQEGVPSQIIDMNIDEAVRVYELVFTQALRNVRRHVLPGAREILAALRQKGYVLAVFTGDLRPLVRLMLTETGLLGFFAIVVTAEDAGTKAAMARIAVRKAGKVDTVVVIGDSIRDIEAGRAIRSKAIGVTTGEHNSRRLKKAGADIILKDLRNTKKVLEAIG